MIITILLGMLLTYVDDEDVIVTFSPVVVCKE
jgi:hypothetical protein